MSKAIDDCYMDASKIPRYLEDGLMDEFEAREVRRARLFEDNIGDDYLKELEVACRVGDISHAEYCAMERKHYLKNDIAAGMAEIFGWEDWDQFDNGDYMAFLDGMLVRT